MKLLAFMVILSVIQAVSPAPRNVANPSTQRGSAENKQPVSRTPPADLPEKTEGDKEGGNDKTSQNTEQAVRIRELPPVSVARDWADWALWVASALLAAVGILGVCLAYRTLRILERQTKAIRRQALSMRRQTTIFRRTLKASRDSADAAADSARAIVATERAWVDVRLEKVGPASYQVVVTNQGRTIAQVSEFHITLEFAADSGMPESKQTLPRSKLLGPNTPWTAIELNLVTDLGRETWEKVDRRIGFSYYGTLHYMDVGNQPHETDFRFVYDRTALVQLEAPIYNRHT